MSDHELRIRLEGRLETLEKYVGLVDRLHELATPKWHAKLLEVHEALEQWARHFPERNLAVEVCLKEPQARAWVDAVVEREQRLKLKLDTVLAGTAAARRPSIGPKLETWAELAKSFGAIEKVEPLATGDGEWRTREWLVTLPAAAAVALMHQPMLMLLLAPLAAVWWDFCRRTVSWRVFKDCVEVSEPEWPTRRIPLASVEEIDGATLRGLWDVTLRGESGFLQFAVDVRRALNEREARARYADQPSPAMWLSASLHAGEPPRATHGWVLACPGGIAFVPDLIVPMAWFTVVGAPPLDAHADIGAELRSLPARLLEEKVVEIARLKSCVWLSELDGSAFQSLGDILLVVIDAQQKLFVRCSLEAQAKLLELHRR